MVINIINNPLCFPMPAVSPATGWQMLRFSVVSLTLLILDDNFCLRRRKKIVLFEENKILFVTALDLIKVSKYLFLLYQLFRFLHVIVISCVFAC